MPSNTIALISTESLQKVGAKQLDNQARGSGIATGSANADKSIAAMDIAKIRVQDADWHTWPML